jgi:hypothetical protein
MIALERENAKTLFALKDEAPLLQFLDELKARPNMKKGGRVLELGTAWDPIHRCLTDGELDPAGGDFPLNAVILGGKKLTKSDERVAMLLRPDVTRFVSDALDDLKEDDLRKKFFPLKGGSCQYPIDEKHFVEMWLRVRDLKIFFDAAAENLEAVVFMGKMSA